MSENSNRSRGGSKAIAIDNRAQLAKLRFLLFLSIVFSGLLALALQLLFAR
jgi:hypothetical protein